MNGAEPRERRLGPEANRRLAVLCSGGLDSAVLLGEVLATSSAVFPVYVRTGMIWEGVEQAHLRRFLEAIKAPALRSVTVLDEPITDVYGAHWSTTGSGVPDQNSPDAAVFLPGRNVLLLSKSLLWCHLNGVPEIALATLEANPFPDATNEFFDAFAAAINMAVEGHVKILRPYATWSKTQVIRRGAHLPLQHTFSCIRPVDGRHCGKCNKCAERRKAFNGAAVADPTAYDEC
jgi:7-cyano-7-deazaguanine synthase